MNNSIKEAIFILAMALAYPAVAIAIVSMLSFFQVVPPWWVILAIWVIALLTFVRFTFSRLWRYRHQPIH